ncbi:MAG: hypothetical protein ACRCUS_00925 [Anaerovoracaceae bacterium]
MQVNKKYPELFKAVSRLLGARRAKRELGKLDAKTCNLKNCPRIIGGFRFGDTPQDFSFWWKLHKKECRLQGKDCYANL